MPHEIRDTSLFGVKLITSEAFEDQRGVYLNLWNSALDLLPEDTSWQEDDLSISKCGVIRGIHGDDCTWKLVSCIYGSIYVVVVDYKGANSNLKWEGFLITAHDRQKILVPPGYGLGHQILSDIGYFWYKQSELYRGAEYQFTLNPFDPTLNILWPIWLPNTFTLSERDKNAEFLG